MKSVRRTSASRWIDADLTVLTRGGLDFSHVDDAALRRRRPWVARDYRGTTTSRCVTAVTVDWSVRRA